MYALLTYLVLIESNFESEFLKLGCFNKCGKLAKGLDMTSHALSGRSGLSIETLSD